MHTLSVDLSDSLFKSMKEFIKSGYFESESDLLQAAIIEFIRKNKIELMEQFLRDDIKWGTQTEQN